MGVRCQFQVLFWRQRKEPSEIQNHKNGGQGMAACRPSWATLGLYNIDLIFLMENKTVGRVIDTKKILVALSTA